MPIYVHFVPIINEFGETCALGSLGKYLKVELDMVDEDGVGGGESHIGEFILTFGNGCDVCSDAFITLWGTLTIEKSCVCILGTGFD